MNVVELVGEGVYGGMPVRGRNALTKEPQYNNAFVFKFDGGKIRSITAYLDTVPVEKALFKKNIR